MFYWEFLGPTMRANASDLLIIQDLYNRIKGSRRLKNPIEQFRMTIKKKLEAEADRRHEILKKGEEVKGKSYEYFLYELITENNLIGHLDALLLTYTYYVRTCRGKKKWGVKEANQFWDNMEAYDEKYEKLLPAHKMFKVLCALLITDVGGRNTRVLIGELLQDPGVVAALSKEAFFADTRTILEQIASELNSPDGEFKAAAAQQQGAQTPKQLIAYKSTTREMEDKVEIGMIDITRSKSLERGALRYLETLLQIDEATAKGILRRPCEIPPITQSYGIWRYIGLVTGFPRRHTLDAMGSELTVTIRGAWGVTDRSKTLVNFILKQLRSGAVKPEKLDDLLYHMTDENQIGEITALALLLDLGWSDFDLKFWERLQNGIESPRLFRIIPRKPLPYRYEVVRAQVMKALLAVVERGLDTTSHRAYLQSLMHQMHEKDSSFPELQLFRVARDRVRLSRILHEEKEATSAFLSEDFIKVPTAGKTKAPTPTTPKAPAVATAQKKAPATTKSTRRRPSGAATA